MNFSKLTLAVATLLSASASPGAFALDLYVDTKTKQLYAEPGPGRQKMGSFVQVEDVAAKPVKPADTAEIAAVREDLALKTNEIKALQEHMTEAEAVKVKLGDKGLEIESSDKNFKMAMGGRLQLDGQFNENDHNIPQNARLNNGAGVRRGRLHMEGTLYKDYDFKFEYDFVRGNGSTAAGITDAWAEYTGFKPFSVTVGQFKEPFSLESVTSNRFLTFLERSLPNNAFIEFANPYLLGISGQSFGERWTARAALQAEPIGGGGYNNNSSTNNQGNANRNGQSGNPTYGVTGRATFLPIFNSKTELLHIGASGSYRTVNNTNNGANAATAAATGGANTTSPTGLAFASQVSDVDRSNWANTGILTDTLGTPNRRVLKDYYRVGAELAGIHGPLSFQSEYIRTQLNGTTYDSSDHLDGYYVYGTYFLTGESRTYDAKKGAFGRQKPNRNFDLKNGGWGAWEVASRFDALDMNTAHVNGGRLQSGTLALNWYLNPHVRVMLDYSHIFSNKTINTGFVGGTRGSLASNTSGQNPDIFMVRTQLDW
ncbi:MAG: porin [Methylobacter sp.]|nr:porin [Methylobacter sp.]